MGLFGKQHTILVIPEGKHCHGRIKRYSLSRTFPLICLILASIVFSGLLLYSIHATRQIRELQGYKTEIVRLRHQAVQQKVQIYSFADKIRLLEREMGQLRQLDRQLRSVADKATLLTKAPMTGIGGSDKEETKPKAGLEASTANLIRRMHHDLDRLLGSTSLVEVRQHELGKYFQDSKSIIAATPTDWPVRGQISSYFGYRSSPFDKQKEFHRGLDIRGPVGKVIVAPADGVVVSYKRSSGYGNILTVNHGYGMVTRYAHLSDCFVESGQHVRRGERIAAVGATGRVTGPHLHYETILNGVPVNPMRFIAEK